MDVVVSCEGFGTIQQQDGEQSMLLKILIGPMAGAIGGLVGSLPFRRVLIHRSAGIGIGVLMSVMVVNLGFGLGWAKLTPALASAGPILLDPFLFGLLAAAGIGGMLTLTQLAVDPDGNELRNSLAADPAAARPPTTPSGLFISYRRSDSLDVTGRIYDRLCQQLGRERVFRDVDSIPAGVDFRPHIEKLIGQCGTCLVVIGPQWVSIKDAAGLTRLADPADHVRQEIESALARNIKVIPVLVGATEMPRAEEVPGSLLELCYRNAIRVRPDPDFHRDMDRLAGELANEPLSLPLTNG
jgi:hypothetical protein